MGKGRNADPAKKSKPKPYRSPWEGYWYNKQNGQKVRVKEVKPGRPSPWTVTMRLPIRTATHPGLLVHMGTSGVIMCDIDFLQDKFQRTPVPKNRPVPNETIMPEIKDDGRTGRTCSGSE